MQYEASQADDVEALFEAIDTDRDGVISQAEFRRWALDPSNFRPSESDHRRTNRRSEAKGSERREPEHDGDSAPVHNAAYYAAVPDREGRAPDNSRTSRRLQGGASDLSTQINRVNVLLEASQHETAKFRYDKSLYGSPGSKSGSTSGSPKRGTSRSPPRNTRIARPDKESEPAFYEPRSFSYGTSSGSFVDPIAAARTSPAEQGILHRAQGTLGRERTDQAEYFEPSANERTGGTSVVFEPEAHSQGPRATTKSDLQPMLREALSSLVPNEALSPDILKEVEELLKKRGLVERQEGEKANVERQEVVEGQEAYREGERKSLTTREKARLIRNQHRDNTTPKEIAQVEEETSSGGGKSIQDHLAEKRVDSSSDVPNDESDPLGIWGESAEKENAEWLQRQNEAQKTPQHNENYSSM